MSLLALLINLMRPWWIKVFISELLNNSRSWFTHKYWACMGENMESKVTLTYIFLADLKNYPIRWATNSISVLLDCSQVMWRVCVCCRRPARRIWWVCLRTLICVPSMPSVSPSCPKTSSWRAASAENEPELSLSLSVSLSLSLFLCLLVVLEFSLGGVFFWLQTFRVLPVCMY